MISKSKDKVIVQTLALSAAFVGQFVSEGVMLSFPVLYPELVNYFKASNAEISVLGSVTYGCWFLIGPVSGKLVDKFGPVKVLMASGFVGALGCLLTVSSTKLWHVIVTFGVIFGTCCGLAFIPAITVVGTYFKKHHHLAITASTVGGAVGGVVYPLCMKAILHFYPWQFCFAVTAYVMLQVVVCGAIFYLKLDHNCGTPLPPIEQADHHDRLVLRVPSAEQPAAASPDAADSKTCTTALFPHWRRNLTIFAVHNFFWNFGDFGFMTMLPLFLAHNGFSTDDIALVISISMFTTILGRLAAAGYCAWPRGDRIFIYNLSTLLSGIFIWLFCAPVNLTLYFICGGGFGFMFGVQTALVPSVTIDLVGHDRTNMALGVAIFASALAGLSSPFAAGLLTDFTGDYYLTFRIGSVVVMVCYFFMTQLHWPFKCLDLRCSRPNNQGL